MFQIIDTKASKIAFRNLSKAEAYRRVDLLNSCGIIRYKAQPV